MADLLRISIFGSMPSGEEWSVNPVFYIGGDFGEPVSSAQAGTIATAIAARTVPAGLLALNPASVTVGGIRVEARSVGGDLEALGEAMRASPAVGSSSGAHGFSAAAVLSLRTAVPGASGRGRVYWPACGVTMNNISLRINGADITAALAGFKTYASGIVTDIETTLTGAAGLAVWSRKNAQVIAVNTIQMGDVLDVQRRRRDIVPESYQSTTWP